jgi:hypothetical protein
MSSSSHALQEIEKSLQLAYDTLARCSASTAEVSTAADKLQRLYHALALLQAWRADPLSPLSLYAADVDDRLSELAGACLEPLINLNSLILTHQRLGVISERHWGNFGGASLANIERELLQLLGGFDALLGEFAAE